MPRTQVWIISILFLPQSFYSYFPLIVFLISNVFWDSSSPQISTGSHIDGLLLKMLENGRFIIPHPVSIWHRSLYAIIKRVTSESLLGCLDNVQKLLRDLVSDELFYALQPLSNIWNLSCHVHKDESLLFPLYFLSKK